MCHLYDVSHRQRHLKNRILYCSCLSCLFAPEQTTEKSRFQRFLKIFTVRNKTLSKLSKHNLAKFLFRGFVIKLIGCTKYVGKQGQLDEKWWQQNQPYLMHPGKPNGRILCYVLSLGELCEVDTVAKNLAELFGIHSIPKKLIWTCDYLKPDLTFGYLWFWS